MAIDIHRISRREQPESDLASGFVDMVAQRAEESTSQMENKEPADLPKDVRRFDVTPAAPVVPGDDFTGLTPENTPGDTLATGGNKHHLDPDPAAPADDYLGGGYAINPEERR